MKWQFVGAMAVVAIWGNLARGIGPEYAYDTFGMGVFVLQGDYGKAMYPLGHGHPESQTALIEAKLRFQAEGHLVMPNQVVLTSQKGWFYNEVDTPKWRWFFTEEKDDGFYRVYVCPTGLDSDWEPWAKADKCGTGAEDIKKLREALVKGRTKPASQKGPTAPFIPYHAYFGIEANHGAFKLDGAKGRALYCIFGRCIEERLELAGSETVDGLDGWAYRVDDVYPDEFFFTEQRPYRIYWKRMPDESWQLWAEMAARCRIAPADEIARLRNQRGSK